MIDDPSNGWEAVSATFAAVRSDIGAEVVRRWSSHLAPSASIMDLGCGTGVPVSATLISRGFTVYGIDASPSLLAMYRGNFPDARTACEPAEASGFFDRRFDGAIAIGLLFLLSAESQRTLIANVRQALHPGGHFLFSAPLHECRWNDALTGRSSVSLGEQGYREILLAAGYTLIGGDTDGGSNNYFHAIAV